MMDLKSTIFSVTQWFCRSSAASRPQTDLSKRSAVQLCEACFATADVHHCSCSERKWTDSPAGFNLSHASPNYSVKPLLQTHYIDHHDDDDEVLTKTNCEVANACSANAFLSVCRRLWPIAFKRDTPFQWTDSAVGILQGFPTLC